MYRFYNKKFTEEQLEVINSYEPLARWYSKNVYTITYGELHLSKPNFEDEQLTSYADLRVLELMTIHSMLWINSKYDYSIEDKAYNAALTIATIFEKNYDYLSDTGRNFLKIDTKCLSKEINDAPDYYDLKMDYLKNKKIEHSNILPKIDNDLYETEKIKVKLLNKKGNKI